MSAQGATYGMAGVDISAGEQAVERIKERVRATFTPQVLAGLGGFGSLFALPPGRWSEPVLVASTDGVGTKAQLAQEADRRSTIGIDLVAMCVDDIVCQGAEPLFFLDYIAVGRLRPAEIEELVEGVVRGCEIAGCALVGGEMAEHPGGMPEGSFDLAGFAVGAVERKGILGPALVRAGDLLIGLRSPGLRCNGYSLVRHVMLDLSALDLKGPAWEGAPSTLAEELLRPSVIYSPAVLKVLGMAGPGAVRAAAHITGGGIPGNVRRILPNGLGALVDLSSWEVPRVFAEVRRLGGVDDKEMLGVFNLGIGMVLVCESSAASGIVTELERSGIQASAIGSVVEGEQGVRFRGTPRWSGS